MNTHTHTHTCNGVSISIHTLLTSPLHKYVTTSSVKICFCSNPFEKQLNFLPSITGLTSAAPPFMGGGGLHGTLRSSIHSHWTLPNEVSVVREAHIVSVTAWSGLAGTHCECMKQEEPTIHALFPNNTRADCCSLTLHFDMNLCGICLPTRGQQ